MKHITNRKIARDIRDAPIANVYMNLSPDGDLSISQHCKHLFAHEKDLPVILLINDSFHEALDY